MSTSELRAWRDALPIVEGTTEEEWSLLEAFHAAPQQQTFARKALASLLNNWASEIDKAKRFRPEPVKRDGTEKLTWV